MLIIGIFGNLGSGKTLSMVMFCELLRKIENSYIITNLESYKNADMHTKKFSLSMKFPPGKKIILAIDEIQAYLDSRKATSNQNVDFSNFLFQIRKMNIAYMIYTSQLERSVDLRLREITDIKIITRYAKPYVLWHITDSLNNPIKYKIIRVPEYLYSIYSTYERQIPKYIEKDEY